jgi:hypothetical protein
MKRNLRKRCHGGGSAILLPLSHHLILRSLPTEVSRPGLLEVWR